MKSSFANDKERGTDGRPSKERRGLFGRPLPSFLVPALAIACLLAVAACAGRTAPPAERTVVLEDVPFHAQERFQCGPAALASILEYYGSSLTPPEIAGDIYCDAALGTLTLDLELFARKKGFEAKSYSGSLEDLRASIDARKPLLVLVDYGFMSLHLNHFMDVVGYEPDAVVVHSGLERFKRIPTAEFMSSWDKTRRWTLLVTPKPS